jgi:hypothetical protein
MNIFGCFERKLWLGDVVQDYGIIRDARESIARVRTSIFLSRRQGQLQLVFRDFRTAPFTFRVHYTSVDVTPETLRRLGEVLLDARNHLDEAHAP